MIDGAWWNDAMHDTVRTRTPAQPEPQQQLPHTCTHGHSRRQPRWPRVTAVHGATPIARGRSDAVP